MGARAFMRRRMAGDPARAAVLRLRRPPAARRARRGLLGRAQARAGAHRARGARPGGGPARAGRLGAAPADRSGPDGLAATSAWTRWPSAISSATCARAEPALQRAPSPSARRPRASAPTRSGERRHVDLGLPRLDAAAPRRPPPASGVRVPTPRRQLHAGLGEHARRPEMKPGKTVVTPTPRAVQVLAQPGGEAAQAELGGRVDRRAGRSRPCRPGSEMNTRWPAPALDHRRRERARELDRRAQVHVERAVDLLGREVVDRPARRQRRRSPRARRPRPARSASARAAAAVGRGPRPARSGRPPSSPRSCSSTSARRPLTSTRAPRRAAPARSPGRCRRWRR